MVQDQNFKYSRGTHSLLGEFNGLKRIKKTIQLTYSPFLLGNSAYFELSIDLCNICSLAQISSVGSNWLEPISTLVEATVIYLVT